MSVYRNNGRRVIGKMVRIDALEFGDPSDQDKVNRYAAMPAETAPPIYVVGKKVLDGMHRIAASKSRGETMIYAEGCIVVK
jgi:hypothetical protein